MKVVVTGGAGFIGSHLVDSLLARNYEVVVIDNLSTGVRKNVPGRAKFHKLDIRSNKIRPLLKKISPDYVCHLAAQVSVTASQADAAQDADINILGALNLAEAVKTLPIKKFVFASSGGAIYGEASLIPTPESEPAEPLSAYGLAKYTVERYLDYYEKTFGLPVGVARLSNIYGPRQLTSAESGVVSIFSQKILRDEELPLHGGGEQTRDYLYVADTVGGIVSLMENGRGVYNFGTGVEISVKELAKVMGQIVGRPPRVAYAPPRSQVELGRSALKCDQARKDLNWRPQTKLEQGLHLTLDWFKKEVL
ncbi:TPA: UDP-glucose 4-epimerase [Patescibacteria group bacterium]|nr:MAG: UDP-glucose 4-epimerase [Parcubacteria group bacterium GW2011_GWA2_46_39]HCU48143.1 UDP-glucose 4-epimerase [Patescibacteria group bacterium]